jgi:hypothetical protein
MLKPVIKITRNAMDVLDAAKAEMPGYSKSLLASIALENHYKSQNKIRGKTNGV